MVRRLRLGARGGINLTGFQALGQFGAEQSVVNAKAAISLKGRAVIPISIKCLSGMQRTQRVWNLREDSRRCSGCPAQNRWRASTTIAMPVVASAQTAPLPNPTTSARIVASFTARG